MKRHRLEDGAGYFAKRARQRALCAASLWIIASIGLAWAREPDDPVAKRSDPLTLAADPSDGGIAVIYPKTGQPYQGFFLKIVEGVEATAGKKLRVASFSVGPDADLKQLGHELLERDFRVTIALGRTGIKAARTFPPQIHVVAGAVVTATESEASGLSVYSLAPDPALLFGQLLRLAPEIKRVFVLYDARQNSWLIELAREAARMHGLELIAHHASDLQSAVRQYQKFLAGANPRADALWLPPDLTTVDDSTVLPFVLQQAWNRKLTVFSSSLTHVERGVLFSLYPDNLAVGRSLANHALAQLALGRPASPRMVPLRDVLIAVNTRSASHLGIKLGSKPRQDFDLVFPE